MDRIDQGQGQSELRGNYVGLFSFFKPTAEYGQAGLPAIFSMSVKENDFRYNDIFQTYSKILVDTADRTHGLTEKEFQLLWDSCVQTEAQKGLITMLASALTDMSDLFVVYKSDVGVLRKANPDEEKQIKADYEKKASSEVGVYISFRTYHRTTMLRIYSDLEYCVLCSLHKSMNLSKAIQVKINELRSSVSLQDASVASDQARSMAKALGDGLDVMMDSKDIIETATPDTSTTEKAIAFLDGKRAYTLNMPMSYISGEQTGGIGSTGEGDMRAVERGLKQYFSSILQPVLKAIYGKDTEFRSQDFREIGTALEAAKTVDLISNDYMSVEAKRTLIARLFGLDEKAEAKLLPSVDEVQPPIDVTPQPPTNDVPPVQ
jgi:hypothetical protein